MQFDFNKISQIKAIIFDLGGVIVNIDYHETSRKFKSLGVKDFDQVYSQFKQVESFDLFEKGLISPRQFRTELKKLANIEISDNDFDQAWFAMLLDTPAERIELIRKLKNQFQLYLLSNTNELHIPYYLEKVKNEIGCENFESLFHEVYYSHKLHLKKPDEKIYRLILDNNGLKPSEVLFIDDTYLNTEAAEAIGINIYLLNDGNTIVDLLGKFVS